MPAAALNVGALVGAEGVNPVGVNPDGFEVEDEVPEVVKVGVNPVDLDVVEAVADLYGVDPAFAKMFDLTGEDSGVVERSSRGVSLALEVDSLRNAPNFLAVSEDELGGAHLEGAG